MEFIHVCWINRENRFLVEATILLLNHYAAMESIQLYPANPKVLGGVQNVVQLKLVVPNRVDKCKDIKNLVRIQE